MSGIDINVLGVDLHPFAALQTWATDLENQASTAINNSLTVAAGINGGSNDPTKVAGTVGGIQSNIAANSAAISALQTQQQQSQVGGASVTVKFPDTQLGSIGPGWTLGGMSTALWAEGNNVAGIQPDNHYSSGTRYAVSTTTMLTNDHAVTMVAGTTGSTQAMTSLIVRAAADMSSFVYLNVFSNHAYLGYGTWNGSAFTFHDWPGADIAISLAVGNTLTLTASGQQYTATLNGATLLAHLDSAGQATVGSSNRSVGMLSQQNVDIFGSAWTGWDIQSFAAADVSSPPTVGTGWSIYQSNSATAFPGSSGWTALGAGTFDAIRQYANVTLTDPGRGVVTIQKTGWYSVTFAGTFSVGLQISPCAGLYLQPSGSSSASVVRCGMLVNGGGGSDNTYTSDVQTANIVYLQTGDRISPALSVSHSGSLTGTGSAGSGYLTYFEGALVSAA
ncbi:hypothetical protein [Nocardia tengchongensis]|uniref:hypothetical protein n=1 Tax=Nocardia tengchongensis TaxID=2055889 RepID=UPI0036A2C667